TSGGATRAALRSRALVRSPRATRRQRDDEPMVTVDVDTDLSKRADMTSATAASDAEKANVAPMPTKLARYPPMAGPPKIPRRVMPPNMESACPRCTGGIASVMYAWRDNA